MTILLCIISFVLGMGATLFLEWLILLKLIPWLNDTQTDVWE